MVNRESFFNSVVALAPFNYFYYQNKKKNYPKKCLLKYRLRNGGQGEMNLLFKAIWGPLCPTAWLRIMKIILRSGWEQPAWTGVCMAWNMLWWGATLCGKIHIKHNDTLMCADFWITKCGLYSKTTKSVNFSYGVHIYKNILDIYVLWKASNDLPYIKLILVNVVIRVFISSCVLKTRCSECDFVIESNDDIKVIGLKCLTYILIGLIKITVYSE